MTESNVVDTNVLEHVFNSVVNADKHIDRLLQKFTEQTRKLCIDRPVGNKKSRIMAEYQHRLDPHLKKMDEEGQLTIWLRYLLVHAEKRDVSVDLSDQLGCRIVPQMNRVNAERSDQIFVYVACALDCVMISNNNVHITDLRKGLRSAARKHGSNNTDFLSSVKAEAEM